MFSNKYVESETKKLLRGELIRQSECSPKDSEHLKRIDKLVFYMMNHMYSDAGWREREVLRSAYNVEIVETPETMFVLRFITDYFGSAEFLFFDDINFRSMRWVG